MRTAIAMVMVLSLLGCSTHRQFGYLVDQDSLAGFKPGITTMEEVRAKFGRPSSVTTSSTGTMLSYSYVATDLHYVPVPFVFAHTIDHKMTTQTTVVAFDTAGKFLSYSASQTDGGLQETKEAK